VTSAKFWNGCNKIAVRILLNHDVKFLSVSHGQTLP
jgi:hypothetical protein